MWRSGIQPESGLVGKILDEVAKVLNYVVANLVPLVLEVPLQMDAVGEAGF